MIAELRVMSRDLSNPEPEKKYPIYFIPTYVMKQVEDIRHEYSQKEIESYTQLQELDPIFNKVIRTMFPTISDDELDRITLENKIEVFNAFGDVYQGKVAETAKN